MRVSKQAQDQRIAMSEFQSEVWQVVMKHPTLTYTEVLQCLAEMQQGLLKDMLRLERFGDTEQPAMSDGEWVEDRDEHLVQTSGKPFNNIRRRNMVDAIALELGVDVEFPGELEVEPQDEA